MLLELRDISKSYEDASILDGVSLSLEAGKSVAVVAPSGAGKSTLLSIAGLLLRPTSGQVIIDGLDTATLDDDELSALRCQRIGFLFQHTHLIGSLRAIENAGIPADFLPREARLSTADINARAKEMLDHLGLEDRLYHFPSQLSNGQKRRIATARALFLNPRLIIADEPTNDLDVANAANVVDALFSRVESGEAGLLIATHDAALAERADDILELA